ncbi:MAG: glycosyltransferase [Vampirovibrionales bacterium]|nr:glycosyltransferase [Vampirovibrionales bacterium]
MTPRSLRLCFVADASNIHVRRWLGYFVAQGHTALCISDKPGTIDGVEMIEAPTRDSLLASGRKAAKTDVVKARARVIQTVAERWRPDVVHAIFLYMRGWSAALANVHPLAITLLGSDIFLPMGQYRNRLHWMRDVALNQGALRQADLVTAVNAALATEARRLAGEATPLALIPIGTDLGVFQPQADPVRQQALRETLALPSTAWIILSPRQIAPIYNIEILLDAMPGVLAKIPNAVLLLKDAFGDSEARQHYVGELKARAQSLGLLDATRWIGEVPYGSLPDYYHLADAVVSIPSTDGLPVTLFDAMACGTPVITGDLPSYDDIAIHERSGLRLSSLTPQALCEALIRLHGDAPLNARLIDGGREIAASAGCFETQMAKMEALYQSLAGPTPGGGLRLSSVFNDLVYKTLIRAC